MARFVVGAAALLAVGRATTLDTDTLGQFGNGDSKGVLGYMNLFSDPRQDKCDQDCTRSCQHVSSSHSSDCQNACHAHNTVSYEYCRRGVCGKGHGLLQAAAVTKHEEKMDEASSPNEGCESVEYYCDALCKKSSHKADMSLGQHLGAAGSCQQDVATSWLGLKAYWDTRCTCYTSGLLQEGQDLEPTDVGSFMQVPREL